MKITQILWEKRLGVRSCGVLVLACLFLANSVFAQDVGHERWGGLLKNFVHNGKVDYKGFKNKEEELDLYLAYLNRMNPDLLTKNEQLAFYINAYNAYTIKLILNHFEKGKPRKSIKKIGGFFSSPWSMRFCKIGGKVYSLDNIEHDILRPIYKDPRVHFAVNCASNSCPPLFAEAYQGEVIDSQLTKVTAAFLNDPQSNYYKDGTLYVSKIFKWFAGDFQGGIYPFFLKYSKGTFAQTIAEHKESIDIEYLDYDWTLNEK